MRGGGAWRADGGLWIGAVAAVVAALASGCRSNPQDSAAAELEAAWEVCRVDRRAVTLPAELDEASGVALSQQREGVIWMHNDSGSQPLVLAVDTLGNLLQRVEVTGATSRDWEAIALGPCPTGDCLYIGDIGDNTAEQETITIWRVAEPPQGTGATPRAERFPIRYPGGPRDAEALFVLPSGDLYLVTKGRDHPVALYRYPAPLQPNRAVELELVRQFSPAPVPLDQQVTGADATADGNWVAIRTYGSLAIFGTSDLLGSGEAAVQMDLGPVGEVQGEGVGIRTGGDVVLVSEGGPAEIPGSMSTLVCGPVSGSRR